MMNESRWLISVLMTRAPTPAAVLALAKCSCKQLKSYKAMQMWKGRTGMLLALMPLVWAWTLQCQTCQQLIRLWWIFLGIFLRGFVWVHCWRLVKRNGISCKFFFLLYSIVLMHHMYFVNNYCEYCWKYIPFKISKKMWDWTLLQMITWSEECK